MSGKENTLLPMPDPVPFGEELCQAFRGEIGKTVFGTEIQVIPQPFLVEIVLNRRNGSLFHECNKERQCLRWYSEHRVFSAMGVFLPFAVLTDK